MTRTTTADRWRISDALWARLRPLLPERPNTHRFGGGRPPKPDRVCADAIFFRLRTGCQWKALDATGICPGSTARDRFQEWAAAGVFLALWKAGLGEYDDLRGIDWAWSSMGGCMTKVPLGGEKTGRNPTDRGKRGVKRSLLTEGRGVPVGVAVDGANRNDFKLARPAPTADAPQGMCLDKGYDYAEVRDLLAECGFTAHIRARGEEAAELRRHAGAKARRWVVERTHSWMNRYRAVPIRWCKKPANYLATSHFACGLIAYRAAWLTG